jgi:type VI secretion system secreted protein VgrG
MCSLIHELSKLIADRQHNRILRISFPNNDGPACQFLVNELRARESVSRDFEYTIEILSDNPSIALKDLQGKLISVELVQHGGTLRYFTGYVFEFRLKRAENIAFYEAKLGPWLKYLSLRKDCYIFHNANVYQQTVSVFEDYAGHALWKARLFAHDPPMTDAFQFEESDYNYLARRWEAAGMHYYYEHNERGHTLILDDDSTRADPIDGDSAICFHLHGGGARAEDTIEEWSPVRSVTASSVQLGSFDFKEPRPVLAAMPSAGMQGDVLPTDSYEYTGAHGFKNTRDGERLARLRMEEIEAGGKRFEAAGNNRCVQPGRWFSLTDRYGNEPFGNLGQYKPNGDTSATRTNSSFSRCSTSQPTTTCSGTRRRNTRTASSAPASRCRGAQDGALTASTPASPARRPRPSWGRMARAASTPTNMAAFGSSSTGTGWVTTATPVRPGSAWPARGLAPSSARMPSTG